MKLDKFKLWSMLTFKTQCYRKNFDFICEDENIITEYEGSVSMLRIGEHIPPLIIGEYFFSVWNIRLGKTLNIDFDKLIEIHSCENTYNELIGVVKNNELDITKYKKIVLIHSFIVRNDYRKLEVTEEFIESIYRDFYDEETAIIALVKPFQNNEIDCEYYYNHKFVEIKKKIGDSNKIEKILASEYYSLDELYNKVDDEYNKYKLFSVVSKCGFNRIGESHLFIFTPQKIHNRLVEKMKGKFGLKNIL